MTVKALQAKTVEESLQKLCPNAGILEENGCLVIEKDFITDVMRLLRNSPYYCLDYLSSLTGVDHLDFFEVIYHLMSISRQHSITIKTRCSGRDNLEIPSVTPIWQGADLQEREIFDLLGINFTGHPNMKRIVLWEGFEGHPLRKDYL